MFTEPSLFARILAHDLRSPITAASEALAMSETASPHRAMKLRQIANENLKRAERMVFGLRSFVRVEGEPVASQEINVRDVVDEVLEEIKASHRDNAAIIRIHGDLGVIPGSHSHASHTFRNLIENAIQHNAELEDLKIEIGRRDDEEAAFYVRDNGSGIPAREHAAIFEPFRRSCQNDRDGMGLGLSLVQSLVGQMGGRVWVESEPGFGATFWFTWPLKTSSTPRAFSSASVA